jgi:hypothetical protein
MDEIFFTGDFASWAVHFVNISVKNQQIHQLFPEDGNVMPKHVELPYIINKQMNKLNE